MHVFIGLHNIASQFLELKHGLKRMDEKQKVSIKEYQVDHNDGYKEETRILLTNFKFLISHHTESLIVSLQLIPLQSFDLISCIVNLT